MLHSSDSPAGLREVSFSDADLYAIESSVVAATPAVLDTGSAEQFADFLVEGGTPHAYIYHDIHGHAVGYMALSALAGSDYMEVRSLAVLPKFQHEGIGQQMMTAAETIARHMGRTAMTLVTSPENTQALLFYRRMGYTVRTEVDDYYGDGTARYVLEKQVST